MILLIGAKGGVGTTLVARELLRSSRQATFVDAADGTLAAYSGRTTWGLDRAIYALGTPAMQTRLIDRLAQQRVGLLWTPEFGDQPEAWAFVRAVDCRLPVIADGGIEPPAGLVAIADRILIISAAGPLAGWHTQQLLALHPGAVALPGTKPAAREIAAQLF